jgi:hypothetical protein
MEKKLKFFFDKQGDVLDISIGEPKVNVQIPVGVTTINISSQL